MNRQGLTGHGRPAAQPRPGFYHPAGAVKDGVEVCFQGEDGRTRWFSVATLPLPGWHQPAAEALSSRWGPSGQLRTLASARACWDSFRRFLRFLGRHPDPPLQPEDLRTGHVEEFEAWRHQSTVARSVDIEMRQIGNVCAMPQLRDRLDPDALHLLTRRRRSNHRQAMPGYSERELAILVEAARADVARIRERIAAGEAALSRDNDTSADLRAMAGTGIVVAAPSPRRHLHMAARVEQAAQLFLTWADVTSLLVLMVAVSGRNVETIKELPSEHRLIDGKAVEVILTKRRRGRRRWSETVTWEIGPPRRHLYTPGGLYLLLHQLCARGRQHSGSTSVWSIWRNMPHFNPDETLAHVDPFAAGLHTTAVHTNSWRAGRDLGPSDDGPATPLRLDFRRLRTTIEARRTRQLGGHLPSAARSNTINVLFSSYLRDDPSTIDWAQGVIGDAFAEAERAALVSHREKLAGSGGERRLPLRPDAGDAVDTGWTACVDPDTHPVSGATCRATLLDCFHCGNCLVTPQHLPNLLALLDSLEQRRQQLSDHDWWRRYGAAWTAIRHDILSRFTPAELERAASAKPAGRHLLDLAEHPWQAT